MPSAVVKGSRAPIGPVAIVGGGAAGMTLAAELARQNAASRIVVFERNPDAVAQRRWSFFTATPSPFESVVERTWTQLTTDAALEQSVALASFRYQTLRGAALRALIAKGAPSIEWVTADVDEIRDDEAGEGDGGVRVVAQNRPFPDRFAFVFDARPESAWVRRRPGAPVLVQSFVGTTIVCDEPRFSADAITLFDFRVSQPGRFVFGYLLPLDARRAVCDLVETAPSPVEMAPLLDEYVARIVDGARHRREDEERGRTWLCADDPVRRASSRVLRIGIAGGRIQPSSGYGFSRAYADAAAITRSLLVHHHPFALPHPRWRDRFLDRVLLEAMAAELGQMPIVFARMMARNPPDRVFALLAEQASFGAIALLAATLPKAMFLLAAWRSTKRSLRPRLAPAPLMLAPK